MQAPTSNRYVCRYHTWSFNPLIVIKVVTQAFHPAGDSSRPWSYRLDRPPLHLCPALHWQRRLRHPHLGCHGRAASPQVDVIVSLIPICQGAGHGQCHCDLHGLHLGFCHVKDFCRPHRRHPCQVLESLKSFHRNVFGRSDYSPPWQWDLLAVWSGVPGGNDLHHLLCPGDQGEDDRGDPADVFLKFGGEKPRTWFT